MEKIHLESEKLESGFAGELVDSRLIFTVNKVDILLVERGLKPGAAFTIYSRPLDKPGALEKLKEDAASIVKILDNSPVTYSYYEEFVGRVCAVSFFVARTENQLDDLLSAYSETEPKARWRSIGLALGIPETAVQAFTEKTVLDDTKLPPSIMEKEEFEFLNFRLSPENWQEEFRVVCERAQAIKVASPKLYGMVLEEARNKKRVASRKLKYI